MKTPSQPKRRAILDAARQAFLAKGYSGASMEAIAEAAPVSKPTLYSHFGGKHELFVAVIADQFQSLFSALSEAPLAQADPVAGLKAIAHAFVDLLYAEESLALYRLLIAEHACFPELGRKVYEASAVPMIELLSDYLVKLDRRGLLAIEDADMSGRLLLGMLQGVKYFRCLMGLQGGLSDPEKQHLVDSAVELFLGGHRP